MAPKRKGRSRLQRKKTSKSKAKNDPCSQESSQFESQGSDACLSPNKAVPQGIIVEGKKDEDLEEPRKRQKLDQKPDNEPLTRSQSSQTSCDCAESRESEIDVLHDEDGQNNPNKSQALVIQEETQEKMKSNCEDSGANNQESNDKTPENIMEDAEIPDETPVHPILLSETEEATDDNNNKEMTPDENYHNSVPNVFQSGNQEPMHVDEENAIEEDKKEKSVDADVLRDDKVQAKESAENTPKVLPKEDALTDSLSLDNHSEKEQREVIAEERIEQLQMSQNKELETQEGLPDEEGAIEMKLAEAKTGKDESIVPTCSGKGTSTDVSPRSQEDCPTTPVMPLKNLVEVALEKQNTTGNLEEENTALESMAFEENSERDCQQQACCEENENTTTENASKGSQRIPSQPASQDSNLDFGDLTDSQFCNLEYEDQMDQADVQGNVQTRPDDNEKNPPNSVNQYMYNAAEQHIPNGSPIVQEIAKELSQLNQFILRTKREMEMSRRN